MPQGNLCSKSPKKDPGPIFKKQEESKKILESNSQSKVIIVMGMETIWQIAQ